MRTGKYEGKKAVVTGGTHGMGLATVKMLLEGGATVLLTARNPANVEKVRQTLGGKVHAIVSDASRIADIRELGVIAREKLGEIDLLFINVGISALTPLSAVTPEEYDGMFTVNTRGSYFTVQELAPIINRGGSIVFTTSVADSTGFAGMSVYSGTKAALRAFARCFAAELLPQGVRVNAVSPGFIDTPTMGVTNATEEERAAFRKIGDQATPMHRHGTPEEVAKAVLFLAFDATFTTGEELLVDGGIGQSLTPADDHA
ncbi:SDR family oxidoreductase [Chitinophaga qingshengii]|uniref:SDR family oxidoreductase n=1 Tax=Chitinophaga qingshengii TaxID=1569794 RepID=A0ABR7TX40_9BACT|nr:SDR family oxidoreductase [Chitinophaga qingshengii]MBC9934997.1 SDR family oxidoreductase [Chitinophaga qingshengii]